MSEVMKHVTPEIYDPESGRFDSLQIARVLDLRPKDMARITGFSDRYIRKDPDARSFQQALKKLAIIIQGIHQLTGDMRQVKLWLNAPHPDLDHDSPLDLIKNNEIDVVVDLVEDMIEGVPA